MTAARAGRRPELTRGDRFRAWLVTGAPARGAGFALEFAAALGRWVARRRGAN